MYAQTFETIDSYSSEDTPSESSDDEAEQYTKQTHFMNMTTLDEYVLELNEEIDELRAKGNKSGLENVLAIKTSVLKLLAKECAAEYKELYGERVDKEYVELFGK